MPKRSSGGSFLIRHGLPQGTRPYASALVPFIGKVPCWGTLLNKTQGRTWVLKVFPIRETSPHGKDKRSTNFLKFSDPFKDKKSTQN